MTNQPLSEKRRELICIDGGRGYGYPEPDVKQAIQEFLKELKENVKNTPIKTEDIVNNKIVIADYIYWKDFRQILDTLAKQNFGDKLI